MNPDSVASKDDPDGGRPGAAGSEIPSSSSIEKADEEETAQNGKVEAARAASRATAGSESTTANECPAVRTSTKVKSASRDSKQSNLVKEKASSTPNELKGKMTGTRQQSISRANGTQAKAVPSPATSRTQSGIRISLDRGAVKKPSSLDREATKKHTNGHKTKPSPGGIETREKHEAETNGRDPRTADVRSPRVGTLPMYGFSFKCDERAAKRKEFYTKLEEKTQAKEVEKTTMQAMSKETQDAELRMLRKSLTFKATPMPNFYQEPPHKAELKKIPPTRARSPKLGRKKSTSPTGSSRILVARSSMDERVSESRRFAAVEQKRKPARSSLPKLPSQRESRSSPQAVKEEESVPDVEPRQPRTPDSSST